MCVWVCFVNEYFENKFLSLNFFFIFYFFCKINNNRVIELRLDLLCCSMPNNLFMTGDTCQTIARGIGFRFSDLRSIFYLEKVLLSL